MIARQGYDQLATVHSPIVDGFAVDLDSARRQPVSVEDEGSTMVAVASDRERRENNGFGRIQIETQREVRDQPIGHLVVFAQNDVGRGGGGRYGGRLDIEHKR